MGRVNVSDTYTSSFRTAFRELKLFVGTQGVLLIVGGLFTLAAGLATRDLAVQISNVITGTTKLAPDDLARFLGIYGALGLASGVMSVLAAGLGTVVADGLRRGERLSLGDAWTRLRPRIPTLFGVALVLLGIGLVFGAAFALVALLTALVHVALAFLFIPLYIACVVIVVILVLRWSLLWPVTILETHGVAATFRRTEAITQGSRGPILGLLILVILSVYIPAGIVSGIVSIPDLPNYLNGTRPGAPSVGVTIAQWVVNTAASIFAGAVLAIALVRMHRDVTTTDAPPTEPVASSGAAPPW